MSPPLRAGSLPAPTRSVRRARARDALTPWAATTPLAQATRHSTRQPTLCTPALPPRCDACPRAQRSAQPPRRATAKSAPNTGAHAPSADPAGWCRFQPLGARVPLPQLLRAQSSNPPTQLCEPRLFPELNRHTPHPNPPDPPQRNCHSWHSWHSWHFPSRTTHAPPPHAQQPHHPTPRCLLA